MGERLLCKQEVIGSIPFTSTTWHLRHPAMGEEARVGTFGEDCETPPGFVPRRGVD